MAILNPSYAELIGEYYPTIEVTISGPDYTDITWETGGTITQIDLDNMRTVAMQTERIIELSESAKLDIVNGFTSSALGTQHWYDSNLEDQLNLIGATASTIDVLFGVRETEFGPKLYKNHTHVELLNVLSDGKNVKLFVLQKFNNKRDVILLATTEAEIDAITWDSVES